MPDIQWGLLSNLQQMAPINTQAPHAQSAPNPMQGGQGGAPQGGGSGGGLLGGLENLLGIGGNSSPGASNGSTAPNPGSGSQGGLLNNLYQDFAGGPHQSQSLLGEGIMGVKSLLNNVFGTNPVSQANAAVSQQIANTPPSVTANQILNSNQTTSSQANNPTPNLMQTTLNASNMQSPQQQANNAFSIQHIQAMAAQQFPNNPVMQQIATSQAIQESNLLHNPSQLATQNNNLFGIKGQGNAGAVQMPTNEYINGSMQRDQAGFAKYGSLQDSMAAYGKLMNSPRYSNVVNAPDFATAAANLQKDGYATDPNYANSLVNINNKVSQNNAIGRTAQVAALGNVSPTDVANAYMGYGDNNHPEVLRGFFKKSLGQDVNPKTTPWCAAFANSVLTSTGHGGTGSLAARSFLNYGTATSKPSNGDVVVMSRGGDPSLGHVGFFSGYSADGKSVKVLGGNESGKVMVKEYPLSTVLGFRTPPTAEELQAKANPQLASNNNGYLPNQ